MATSSDLSVSVTLSTSGATLTPSTVIFDQASTGSITFSIDPSSPATGTLTGFALEPTTTGVTVSSVNPNGQTLTVEFGFGGTLSADTSGFSLSYTSQGTAGSTTGQVMNNGTTVRYDPSGPHG